MSMVIEKKNQPYKTMKKKIVHLPIMKGPRRRANEESRSEETSLGCKPKIRNREDCRTVEASAQAIGHGVLEVVELHLRLDRSEILG
ncbi:hypothetical protein LIER_17399 [Lithospermum erythrorhizon]|uniref:Uncharacterized protein n=1 Tax=Lithospermum erythrorhizon TaxID=34254 RepID=A0AAV3QEA7_LITER